MENDIIDPLNLPCGCRFTPQGELIAMCEEAGRLRAVRDLEGYLTHFNGAQPVVLAPTRLKNLHQKRSGGQAGKALPW